MRFNPPLKMPTTTPNPGHLIGVFLPRLAVRWHGTAA